VDVTEDPTAQVVALFDSAAPTYENVGVPFFAPIGERLVAEVAPRSGERAIDIGCGRGAALIPLAEAVGSTGRVTGIDLAPRMVEGARAAVRERGLGQVDVAMLDAADPHLDRHSFDVVVSSLVLFFLPDPLAALRAWRELMVPGGRLGLATFRPRDPRWLSIDALFLPYLPPATTAGRQDPHSPFNSDKGMAELVAAAGFDQVRTVGFDLEVPFVDADQWYAWSWSTGQRQSWLHIPPDQVDRVRTEAGRRLREMRDPDGITRFLQKIRFTLAVA
jgi:ubiquinone/menaquinone biosynthesis C-methylase UbiE